jgi:hypothetical protein
MLKISLNIIFSISIFISLAQAQENILSPIILNDLSITMISSGEKKASVNFKGELRGNGEISIELFFPNKAKNFTQNIKTKEGNFLKGSKFEKNGKF